VPITANSASSTFHAYTVLFSRRAESLEIKYADQMCIKLCRPTFFN